MEYFKVYTAAQDVLKRNVNEFIKKYENENRRVIMFSTNTIADLVVNMLKNTKVDVEFVIDNSISKQGMEMGGKKVKSPQFLLENYDDNYLILIASSYQNDMIKQLEEYGYKINKHIIKIIDLPELMNDFSHVDRNGMQKLSVNDVREVQLGILEKLNICSKKYGIRYYITAGTLLGAVRHKGYIPWDDDIDVYIPIPDFLKLINILSEDKKYKVISQFNTNCYFGFGLGFIVDCDTVCDVNKFPIQFTSGQSIDVFPLFGVPDGENELEEYVEKIRKFERDCLVTLDSDERQLVIDRFNEFLLKKDYENSNRVGNIMMPYFLDAIYDKETIGTGAEVEFESLKLNTFEHYIECLEQTYGDYMTLPPIDKRVGKHYFNTYWNREIVKD